MGNERLKFLFYNLEYPNLVANKNKNYGGHTVQLHAWCQGLNSIDQSVGVITYRDGTTPSVTDENTNLVQSFIKNRGVPGLRWIYYRIPSLIIAINKFKPDVLIQATASIGTGIIAICSILSKVTFIYRAANNIDSDGGYRERLSWFSQKVYQFGIKYSSGIACQNEYQYANFRKEYPNKPLIILHNPLGFSDNIHKMVPKSERSYIAWLGIFQYQKNLPQLLEIVESFPKVRFKLAGKSTSNIDDVTKSALDRLKTCPNVEFTGFIPRGQILEFLSKAYLTISTSHYEGFSNTYLESLAAGTPVVCTEKIDPDSIIKENNLGYVAKDSKELHVGINTILNDVDFADMSERCKNYALEAHDPAKKAKELLEFILKIKE